MLAYSLYAMLAIGLAVLLTAVFRQLRRDDRRAVLPEDDAAFDRRIKAIEDDYGLGGKTPDTAPGARGEPE